MEATGLIETALKKYQELWDRMEDIRTGITEIQESTQEMLEDIQSELTDLRLETGGWLKLIESMQQNNPTLN